MPSNFLISTDRSALNAVRFQGLLVTEGYAQIQSTLQKNLSVQHAHFFAEPAHSASGDSTDWYTEAEGSARPFSELSEEERVAARQLVGKIASDVARLAGELKDSGDPAKLIRGNMLALALTYPDVNCLYLVGKQPVLVNWGFAPASSAAAPENLVRMGGALAVAAPPVASPVQAAPEPVAVSAVRSFSWLRMLGWLLAGFLLCLALLLLLSLLLGHRPGCGFFGAGDESGVLPVDPEQAQALARERAEEQSLLAELEALRLQLSQKSLLCVEEPAKPSVLAEAPPQPEAPRAELDDMLKPDATEPLTFPDPPKPTGRPGDDLVIPEDAQEKNDFSFLSGCWTTGELSSTSGSALQVTYCFNENGTGERRIRELKTKDVCTGKLRSRFGAGGKLVITESPASCRKSRTKYNGYRTECAQGKSGKAECYGVNPSDKSNRWKAEFKRKK